MERQEKHRNSKRNPDSLLSTAIGRLSVASGKVKASEITTDEPDFV
jgi:hypothetical protein